MITGLTWATVVKRFITTRAEDHIIITNMHKILIMRTDQPAHPIKTGNLRKPLTIFFSFLC